MHYLYGMVCATQVSILPPLCERCKAKARASDSSSSAPAASLRVLLPSRLTMVRLPVL